MHPGRARHNLMATLAGRCIVITRPAGEAQRLAALTRDAGGEPLLFPVIEIHDALDPQPLEEAIAHLDEIDVAIFISPSAVDKALPRITAQRALPARLHCAAIGPGGARALARCGVQTVTIPTDRYDSESLLATNFMRDVQGKRIAIFRGDGGRELLRDTLAARGASVHTVTCYRRVQPALDAAPLLQAWARGTVAAVILTSSEGLRNLCAMIGAAGAAYLRDTLVVVPHPRIALAAQALGLLRVVVSDAGDEALMRTVVSHVAG